MGGSGLLAMGLGDRPTQDVDVVAFVHAGELVSAAPFPETLQEAADRVADDFGLKRTWLNHGPTRLLDFGLPDGFEDRMTTKEHGPGLRVSFASRLDPIHRKLYAFADRREPRDEADLRQLAPTADERARPRIRSVRRRGAYGQRRRVLGRVRADDQRCRSVAVVGSGADKRRSRRTDDRPASRR